MKPDHMAATITQHDLRRFLDLRDQVAALKRRYERERRRLRRLVDANAPVEHGRFQVTVQEFVQRRVNKAFLVALLGEEEYECLRSEVPPTTGRRLLVRDRARTWASFAEEDGSWPS